MEVARRELELLVVVTRGLAGLRTAEEALDAEVKAVVTPVAPRVDLRVSKRLIGVNEVASPSIMGELFIARNRASIL